MTPEQLIEITSRLDSIESTLFFIGFAVILIWVWR